MSATLVSARVACAQPVLGAGDDATLPAPGQVRARGEAIFGAYGSTFGGGPLRGIGANLSADSLGPTQFPRLTAARDTIRAITGNSGLALSLGRVQVRGYAQTLSVPVQVEFGVTRRFALSVLVPFNRTHMTIATLVNPGGVDGNFGLNPANASFSNADSVRAALSQNGAAQANLAAAVTALRNAGYTALADSVQRFANGLASVYGTAQSAGANVVPLVGSDAQRAVAQQLAHFAASARAVNVTTLDPAKLPAAASARIGLAGYRQALSDTSFGLAAPNSLQGGFRRSVGDVQLTGSFLLLDTFRATARPAADTSRAVRPGVDDAAHRAVRARTAPVGLQLRSTVTAGWQFGTGHGTFPGLLLDLPPATGANALLLRSVTDLAYGPRFSATGSVRLTAPVADTRRLRITSSPDSGYAPLYTERDVGRQLGRELELELTPRFAAGEAFAVVGQALLRTRQADRYTGTFTATPAETGSRPVTLDAATLGIGTAQREVRAGLGIAYSTMAAWARGRSSLPVELSFLHAVSAAGSGRTTPKLTTDVLSLRVYAALRRVR